jgi:hypothetical protein
MPATTALPETNQRVGRAAGETAVEAFTITPEQWLV